MRSQTSFHLVPHLGNLGQVGLCPAPASFWLAVLRWHQMAEQVGRGLAALLEELLTRPKLGRLETPDRLEQ